MFGRLLKISPIIVITALLAFATLFRVWLAEHKLDDKRALEIAMREMDAGRPDAAVNIAKSLRFDPETEEQLEQKRRYILGHGSMLQADAAESEDDRRLMLSNAIELLQQSRQFGFPDRRETEGLRILSEGLFLTGKYPEAATAIANSLRRDPSAARELLPMLIKSQLRVPGLEADALATSDRLVSITVGSEPLAWQSRLLRAEALLVNGQFSTALKMVDQAVEHGAPLDRAKVARGKLKILQARKETPNTGLESVPQLTPDVRSLLQSALDDLLSVSEAEHPDTVAQSRYLAAIVYRMMGQFDAAIRALAVVRQWPAFKAVVTAAGIEELEILAMRPDSVGILDAADALKRTIGDLKTYEAAWVTLDSLRRRLNGVVLQLQEDQRYQLALNLAKLLPPLISTADALRLQGIVYEAWAKATSDEEIAEAANRRSAEELRRMRFRKAGEAFAEAAFKQFEAAEFVPYLWDAVRNAQAGHAYGYSLELLNEYLLYEASVRRPRGLIAKGRALLALDRPEEALSPLLLCAEGYPRDPLRSDARLLAAIARTELNELDAATELLTKNLNDPGLSPSGPAWRDSLFALGEILYRKAYDEQMAIDRQAQQSGLIRAAEHDRLKANHQTLVEASIRLDEAVQRYPQHPRALMARYRTAVAQQLAAAWPEMKAQQPETLDAARRKFEDQRTNHLQRAKAGFESLRHDLNEQQENLNLSADEELLLRYSYLAEADTLFEMEEYEQASRSYQSAAHRFGGHPAALEAILGQARCFQMLGRTNDVERLYQQAKQILDRISPELDAEFARSTRYDREGWEELLGWLH